jgi:putative endonuclease
LGEHNETVFVYILANKKYGVLYIGVTSDLVGRVWQHKEAITNGFSRKYNTKILIYFEAHESAESAIMREKQLKKWNRMWKINLIEKANPAWKDLSQDLGFFSGNLRFPPSRE